MWRQIYTNLYMRYYVIFFMFCIAACSDNKPDKPLQKIEIKPEAKKITVEFSRFDNDLFADNFNQPDSTIQLLKAKYGSFFCDFVERDLMLAPCNDPKLPALLKPFVTNHDIVETRKEIETVFTPEKINRYNEELTAAFQRWNHFFPDSVIPQIIYYQSAWNNNIACSDSALGISLDCYLGKNNRITKQLSPEIFPNYKKANMEERYLVADAVKGWVAYKSRHYYQPKDMLNELVFYGKLMYIAEAMAPHLEDSLLMSWSSKQLAWAENNEWNIWKTLANEKVMFNTKTFDINKWFIDGPFTGAKGVPQESPPQLGVWFGWKMVRQFMDANPTFTPQQLLQETDNRKILSAYKPKR